MSARKIKRLVRHGRHVAEVEVNLLDGDHEWFPQYSLADVRKMEKVETALKKGDLKTAAKLARLYTLTPVKAA